MAQLNNEASRTGAQAIVERSEPTEHPISISRDSWQVHYARFITYPSLPSKCPSLVPRPNNKRYRRSKGNWITSRSPIASLKLLNHDSPSDAILSISGEKILEQHYVSMLSFSWPQVSCVPGYPSRGIRSVFASYKDSSKQIQKFAFRFSTTSEAEMFINLLQDILKDETEFEPQTSLFQSEASAQSVFMPNNRNQSRDCVEESTTMSPVITYTPEIPLNLESVCEKEFGTRETTLQQNFYYALGQEKGAKKPKNNAEDPSPALPPSFATLLSNCYVEPPQAAAAPNLHGEPDLKSQIVRYMEDSSFQDMLVKVEKVMSEIAHEFLL